MRDTFCALPFTHLALLPDGTAKMCCMAAARVSDGGAAMSVHRHPIEAIWNSRYMADVRARMLAGAPVRDCEACYRAEATSGSSYRTSSNARWPAVTQGSLRARVEPSAPVEPRPISWQLMPGNACNLKCRMCSPLYSSRIAADPVHARWSRVFIDSEERIDGRRERVRIAPARHVDVVASGVHRVEHHAGEPLQWTDGHGRWELPVPAGAECRTLEIRFLEGQDPRRRLEVRINGSQRFAGRLRDAMAALSLPLAPDTAHLVIECDSDATRPEGDARMLGVALREVAITTPGLRPRKRGDREHAHLPTEPWHADRGWVENTLLGGHERLQALYITGGEPMYTPQVAEALAYLQAQGAAPHIELELNSNGTIVDDALIERLLAFKHVALAVSIDGHGAVNEYIRHPSSWAAVEANLLRLHALRPDVLTVSVITIVQAYNALQVTDLLRFLQRHGIAWSMEVATDPAAISVGVLPPAARKLAIDRLVEFAATLPPGDARQNVEATAAAIRDAVDLASPAAIETLLRFTDDLDRARGQDFRSTCPELHGMLHARLAMSTEGVT